MPLDTARLAAILAETRAVCLDRAIADGLIDTHTPLHGGDAEHARGWILETGVTAADALDYLDTYTSAKNGTTASASVTDPIVQPGVVWTGLWRAAYHRKYLIGGKTWIVQVLRKGYVANYAALASEVPLLVQTQDRLINPNAKLSTALDQTVEYKYRGIEKAQAAAIKDAFRAAHAGVLDVTNALLDDGSVELHYTTLARTWVTATKASATENTEERDYTGGAANAGVAVARDFNQITQASVPVILDDPVPAWVTGTVYAKGAFVLDSTVYYRCAVAHTAAAAFATDLAAGKWLPYALTKATGEDKLDGSGRVSLGLVRVWTIATIADLQALTPIKKFGRDVFYPFGMAVPYDDDDVVLIFRNLSPASEAVIMAFTDANYSSFAPTGYYFTYAKLIRDENGTLRLDLDFKKISVKDQLAASGEVRADETSAINTHEENTAQETASPGDGEIVDVDNRPIERGLFKTRKRVRTAISQTITGAVTRADETAAEEIVTQAAAALTPPTPNAGEIVESSSQPTEFKNKHRTRKNIRTAVSQTITGAVTRADETAAEEVVTQATAALTPPTPGDGEIVESSSQPTEFKDRHRTRKNTRTAVNQTATNAGPPVTSDRHVETAFEKIDEEVNTAAAAALADVALAAGVITEIENTPTPYKNKVRTRKRTRTPVEAHGSRTFLTLHGTANVLWGRNRAKADYDTDIATVLATEQASGTAEPPNEYGLYDYVIVRVPHAAGAVRVWADYAWHYSVVTENASTGAKELKTRTISVKFTASESTASAWASASNAPGAFMGPVEEGGMLWKAIKVVDS